MSVCYGGPWLPLWIFYYYLFFYFSKNIFNLGKTYLSILSRETSLGSLGWGGGLLLDVSVNKMEIIDFRQPRIKQELPENIIVTTENV